MPLGFPASFSHTPFFGGAQLRPTLSVNSSADSRFLHRVLYIIRIGIFFLIFLYSYLKNVFFMLIPYYALIVGDLPWVNSWSNGAGIQAHMMNCGGINISAVKLEYVKEVVRG